MFNARYALCLYGFLGFAACLGADQPLSASRAAAELDGKINWTNIRLMAVQDAGRYKTFTSFAREAMTAMYGAEQLPGLSPEASALDWLFRREAYQDAPVIRIRDQGLRIDFTTQLPDDRRERILSTGRMTPNEFADPSVQQRIEELEPRNTMATAIGRVRDAQVVAQSLERMLRIVPQPGGAKEDLWFTPEDLLANMPADVLQQLGPTAQRLQMRASRPIENMTPAQAVGVVLNWARLRSAWLAGNAKEVQANLDQLAATVPLIADAGVYPTTSQRQAEAHYYAMGKFTWGWFAYFVGALFSILCLITGWRWAFIVAQILLMIGLGIHAYGIALRWQILGRVPVANMFEAITGSALLGITVPIVLELTDRFRFKSGWLRKLLMSIYVLAASIGSALAMYLIWFRVEYPRNDLGTWILIFASFLVLGFYLYLLLSSLRALPQLLYRPTIRPVFLLAANMTGFFALMLAAYVIPGGGTLTSIMGILDDIMLRIHTVLIISSYALIFVAAVIAVVYLCGYYFGTSRGPGISAPTGPLGAGFMSANAGYDLRRERPIAAGDMPGDEGPGSKLPQWLVQMDWCHLIILNLVFIMLFVGTVLGAVWADYSWGRPWGWDPKEVFALNTWLVYAILIHTRLFVTNKGVWTAWLSVAGCAMMAFNWCFVNFFIVGLHSYA